jgi:hypothetical protein
MDFSTTWTPLRCAFASGDQMTSWPRQSRSGCAAPWGDLGRQC